MAEDLKQLDRYEVLHLIGKGGMGRVFLGRDTQTNQSVAIKVLLPEALEDKALLQRLQRESEALRVLNHPHIVKILDVIEDPRQYSLILEYIEGGTLADLLRKQPQLPLDEVLKISLGIADALARTHQLKIIHRDIKPANVLLDKEGVPRLTDFGLARLESSHELTQTGVMVGSAAYLSPETIRNLPLDPKVDIWAFGVLLFEMLAGRRPFEADNTAALLAAILMEPVPDLAALRPNVPPQLAALVYQMLAKDPAERLASARRVGVELESIMQNKPLTEDERALLESSAQQARLRSTSTFQAVLTDEPTIQAPTPDSLPTIATTRPDLASMRSKKSPMGIVIAAGMILAFLLGLLIMVQLESDVSGELGSPSELVFEPETVTPAESGQVMVLVAALEPLEDPRANIDRFIADDLRQVIELGAPLSGLTIRQYPHPIRSQAEADQVAELNQVGLLIWGNYSADLIEVDINLHTWSEAQALPKAILSDSGNVRLRLADERQQSIARQVLSAAAIWYAYHGDAYQAASVMVSFNELQVDSAEIVGVSAGAHVHRHYENLYTDTANAVASLDQALLIAPQNPMLYHLRAAALDRLKQPEQAVQDIESAVLLSQRQWAIPFINVANIYVSQGDFDAAIQAMTDAIAIQPDDWLVYTMRGSFYYLDGDFEPAQADLAQSIALQPQANFPYVLSMNLAIREGRINEVQAVMATVLEQFPDPTFGNRIILTANNQSEYGGFYGLLLSGFANLILRQTDNAIADISAAIELGNPLPELYLFLGVAQCINQDYASAEASYTAGLEADPDFTVLYLMRADARRQQNNLGGALQDFTAAQATTQWANFADLVNDPANANLGCESFFGAPS
jgi:serine/threonine protein kinase/tetratricopeptide (TPR) repeat protein